MDLWIKGRYKNLGVILIISGVLITITATFFWGVLPAIVKPATNLWLGDGIFKAVVASDDSSRLKVSTGVSQLNADEALLIAYPTESKWEIDTSSIKIPIDIVWLDKSKHVIYIVKSASSEASSATYGPKTQAQYIVELPAGTVDSKGVNINNMAVFQINSEDIK